MNTNEILQRGGGVALTTIRISSRVGRGAVAHTFGLIQRASHIRQSPKPGMDDVTLARKVETELFRGSGAPKSTVDVNVVDGVVWLRGEVKRASQVQALEKKALTIPEVRGVENLLHLAKTPASTRADTPRRQQRTRSSTQRPTPRTRTGGRVTDDRTDAIVEGEPTPAEHARRQEGRTPAPFGSVGEESREESAAGPNGESGSAPNGEPSTAGNGEPSTTESPSPQGSAGEPTQQFS